ncbi:hypothetical protein BOTBODRAFT_27318 [Botryobasidium botryosum FD-172 SS1]|uniref:Zn(2)-C6 fungal-type domain-containing protein n=1 Tax=Botryobasidium botryosum (strain FD-172 SS1) TaxID=930990 RepID=A0A067N713_BOTB1|nr:hypothetical protein BOTBODRAFT_27318 [Botryobasidium botryosum FD-172 SS1]
MSAPRSPDPRSPTPRPPPLPRPPRLRSPPPPPSMSSASPIKHDSPADHGKPNGDDKPPVRPHKPLNRVPRACNACRKQKMRCEGAENPPCKRCRHAGIDCMFEKPVRDTALTSEQGMERIRNLETQVTSIQTTLTELVTTLRGTSHLPPTPAHSASSLPPMHTSSPHFGPYPGSGPSPTAPSPVLSNHSHSGAPNGSMQYPPMADGVVTHSSSSEREYTPGGSYPMSQSRGPPPGHHHHRSHSEAGPSQLQAPLPSQKQYGPIPYLSHPSNLPGSQPPFNNSMNSAVMHPPTSLPPFSSLQGMVSSPHPAQFPPHLRPRSSSNNHGPSSSPGANALPPNYPPLPHINPQSRPPSGHYTTSRNIPPSAVTSADSTDEEGELPMSGLTAPFAVLRNMAQEAADREDDNSSETRTRSHSPHQGRPDRPPKRRKTNHRPMPHAYPDVVTKGLISEHEARELFEIFYRGCSTFLPIFDPAIDTFDDLHKRSPFCVDCICMVGARVRDGGGPASETYTKILDEVQAISCQTLFSPVARQEAVQAMILVAGWSTNQWLSGGHAVRMALEIGMHKSWPKLAKRIRANKMSTSDDERELLASARTFLCLFLFEHQLSFGTGRPAILREDESVADCQLLLQHPLAIQDDSRLVSMVELMIIRERVHNRLAAVEGHDDESAFQILAEAHVQFDGWYERWDGSLAQQYDDGTFYRQSLQIQRSFAELFHNATALRGIRGPDDVAMMPPKQRKLAMRTLDIARRGLSTCLRSDAYREGMKYAVDYTHVTATFVASFLMRLARLFPHDCDPQAIMQEVEELATLLSQIPATRYARTLRLMLRAARKRRLPHLRKMSELSSPGSIDSKSSTSKPLGGSPAHQSLSPTAYTNAQHSPTATMTMNGMQIQGGSFTQEAIEQLAPGFQLGPGDEVPLWLHDSNLGSVNVSLAQYGLEAFLIPAQFSEEHRPVPEIW